MMTPILSDDEIRAIVRDIPARPYRAADGEPMSVRIARAVESAVLAKLAARGGELRDIAPSDHPEPWSLQWSRLEIEWIQQYARDHAAGMLARMGEPAARLPFHIETRAGIRVLVEKSGGCHPATIYELAMWDAIQKMPKETKC
jgi:hypothetical protein